MDIHEALHQRSFYQTLLDHLSDGVYAVDRDRRIVYWNQGAERTTGYTRAEVLGRSCADNLLMHIDDSGRQLCLGLCPLAMTVNDGLDREAAVYLQHKQGYRRPVRVRVAPIRDASGTIIGAIEVFNDNASELLAEKTIEELRKSLLLDPLTNISNRRFIEIGIHSKLAEKRRYDRGFGILFADIDHFKRINDTLGHDVGDAALKMVAKTLANAARASDIVGRWGGEEFVCLVQCDSAAKLHALAERMRVFVSRSQIEVKGQTVAVTISVGGVLAQPDQAAESLIEMADEQMYLSKQQGRNRVTILETSAAETAMV